MLTRFRWFCSQETAAAAATATNPPEAGDAPCTKSQVSAEEAEKPADVSTASVLSDDKQEPSSPASPDTTNPEESGAEKKKKPKKKWSFRSFSFSKKDKVKPATKDEKQETVPEVSWSFSQTRILKFRCWVVAI